MLTKSTFVSCVQKIEGLEQSLENVRKIALARREVTGVIAKITPRMEGTLPTLGITHHSERSANGLRFWERIDPGLYFCSKLLCFWSPEITVQWFSQMEILHGFQITLKDKIQQGTWDLGEILSRESLSGFRRNN